MATKKTPARPERSSPTAARTPARTPAPRPAAARAKAPATTGAPAARPAVPAADDLAAVRDRLAALPADRLRRPYVDVAAAATLVGGVAKKLASGPLRARFLRLPKEELDPRLLDDLALFGRAALTAHQRRAGAAAQKTEARVPYALVEEGSALRRRMLRLVTYYFEDHAEHGPEIAAIRAGSGHLDLASDLDRLAALCAAEAKVLAADTRDHRPTDARDARACAGRIREALGEDDEDAATDTWMRAFTLLAQTYDEVAATGRWLLRRDPKAAAALFPALGSVRREPHKPRARPAPAPAPGPA